MKRRRFRQRVTRATIRIAGTFEALFRQLFGGFLNCRVFYRVFIPILGVSFSFYSQKISGASVWGFLSAFPVSFSFGL